VTPKEGFWQVFPDVIPPLLVDVLRDDLAYAWTVCRQVQIENGVADDADRTVHHLLAITECSSFRDLIQALHPLDDVFRHYFGGAYILNSLGGALLSKGHPSYANRIHRDVRSFQDTPLVLNTLVMLDDFTAENGATWMGTASRTMPGSEYFYDHATQATGRAGSVLVFDSNLWHAGGENRTDSPRRSITPMLCKPNVKPQFDYCRALGDPDRLSEYQRQVIGYYARIPATLSEWYQPPEKRFFRGENG
jgi:hypothetical protein